MRVLVHITDSEAYEAQASFISKELEDTNFQPEFSLDMDDFVSIIEHCGCEIVLALIDENSREPYAALDRLQHTSFEGPVVCLFKNQKTRTLFNLLTRGVTNTACYNEAVLSEGTLPLLMVNSYLGYNGAIRTKSFGSLTIDYHAKTVSFNETRLKFTARQYDVLEYLSLHEGEIIKESDLLDNLYGHDIPESNSLHVFVSKIRKILDNEEEGWSNIIETRKGHGYRFRPYEELQEFLSAEVVQFPERSRDNLPSAVAG